MKMLYCASSLVTFVFFVSIANVSHSQERVGTATPEDVSAYELYAARFSVDGKRRLDFSAFYVSNTTNGLITSSSRQAGGSISYTHPVTEELELSIGVSSSLRATDVAFGDVVVSSQSDFSKPGLTIGSRLSLIRETDILPEFTLFGAASTTSEFDEWRGEAGLSFVTTSYPAFLYGSIGIQLSEEFFEGISYTAGVSLAINDKLSIGGEFAGTVSANAAPGQLGETALFGSRIIYAIDRQWSLDANVSIGLTEESPDMALGLTVGYRF